MVELAESFNKTLMEHEAQRQQLPEDAQFIIESSMARLGLHSTSPVASEGGKEDERQLEDLARELGSILTSGPNVNTSSRKSGALMQARGMIALDEVWGAWNRARGVGM